MPINRNVPPATGLIRDSDFRDNFAAIDNKIGGLPEVYSTSGSGVLVTTNDDSNGLTTAALLATAVSGGHRQFGRMKPWTIEVASNLSLTTSGHEGALLLMRNTGGIVLQLEVNANPNIGVQHLFSCTILRPTAAGSVQVSSSTLTNDHPDTHTRVAGGQVVTVFVDGVAGTFYLLGGTAA